MAAYPGAIPDLSDGAVNVAGGHGKIRDELAAVIAELGVDPSGSAATVAARLAALSLTIQDDGANVATEVKQIDFVGAGVTVTTGTGEVVVTIPGGGGGGGTGTVTKVNGETPDSTGAVVLDFTDVGAAAATHDHTDTLNAVSALDARVNALPTVDAVTGTFSDRVMGIWLSPTALAADRSNQTALLNNCPSELRLALLPKG